MALAVADLQQLERRDVVTELTQRLHVHLPDAAEVVDLWFFETAVRFHREGEGASFTGLKPAGLDWGPVVPLAEKDIEKEDPTETVEFLKGVVEEETRRRFQEVIHKKDYDLNDVDAARDYTETMHISSYLPIIFTNLLDHFLSRECRNWNAETFKLLSDIVEIF